MIKIVNTPSLYASLYETVSYCAGETGPINIVVPDKLSLFMERFLFEKLEIESSFDIKVTTLNRIALKSCPINDDKMITKDGSVLLIHKIMNENREKFLSFKSDAYTFKYAEEVYKTLSQFKASKISSNELENFSSTNNALSGKIHDLSIIYNEYEKGKAGLLDRSDFFLMSSMFIARGRQDERFLLVGFDDYTAVEYSIIERLAISNTIVVMNYATKAKGQDIYNREVVDQLKNIAYVNELPYEEQDGKEEFSNLKSFLHENLFSLTKNTCELTNETVKVFNANTFEQEVEFVARDIRNRILDGARYKDFGVAVFDLDGNEHIVERIFKKYEINFYIDEKYKLTNSILYKFIMSLFKYKFESYNLSHLIDVISSPFLILDGEKKRTIIQKLMTIGFKGRLESVDLFDDKDDDKKVALNDGLSAFKNFINLFNIDVQDEGSVLADKISKFLLNIDAKQTIENICEKSNIESRIFLSKSYERFLNLMEEIAKFYPTADIEKFYDILQSSSSTIKINSLPVSIDMVRVVDANNTMEIFENYYLVSCNKSNAPNLKYDCGIILDKEIEELNFANKLSPTIAHINHLSKLRLFNTTLLFEKNLTITYSKEPSELIEQIEKKLYVTVGNKKVFVTPIKDIKFGKYISLSNWDTIEYLCRRDKKNKKIFEKLIKNKEIDTLSNKNLNIFNNFDKISASKLENYFKCPFNFFLNNILKIEPKEESDIMAFDVGNILHDIVYEYYKRDKKIGDKKEFCSTKILSYIRRDERLKSKENSPILKALVSEACRVLNGLDYIDENSGFSVDKNMLEYGFFGDSALRLKNISVEGKIDRVDKCGDMLRVVDYKTGKATPSNKELYYGRKLQLFLYSCALEDLTNKKVVGEFYLPIHNNYAREEGNPYALKGFFLNDEDVVSKLDTRLVAGDKSDIVNLRLTKEKLASKTPGNKELSDDDLGAYKEYAKKISEKAADEIRSGYIKPSPSEVDTLCKNCPYRQICLHESSGISLRRENMVNIDSFKGEE